MSLSKRWPVLAHWRLFFIFGFAAVLLPLIFLDDPVPDDADLETKQAGTKFKCAYIILLMALYWIVEVVPLAMTSFLPVVLIPIMGIQSTGTVTMNYMRETNMMFIGGLIISAAVEFSNLHRRIALRVLTLIGSSPPKLVLGIMLTTMFLSMWMLNSAATSMMIPITLAVLEELEKAPENLKELEILKGQEFENDGTVAVIDIPQVESSPAQKQRQRQQQRNMMLLSIAYASNIGGSGVVTGTTPNLVTFGILQGPDWKNWSQNGKYLDLTFATFMAYSVLPMLVNVLISWTYLIVTFLGFPNWMRFGKKQEESTESKVNEARVKKMLMREYKALGRMNFHQSAVTLLFVIVVLLWFFRDPRFIDGWGKYFPTFAVADSTATMLIAFLLFTFPRDPSFLYCRTPKIQGALLEWRYVQLKLPWDIALLMGSGFAISDAAEKSGLSAWLGEQLASLSSLDNAALLIIVMALTACVTEVLSNAAAANLVIPILLGLSKKLGLHPLYLTLPACIACSFAFCFPVAAPSNGLIFAAADGKMKILDMVKSGAFLNVICTVVMFLLHISYGNLIFDFNNYEYPTNFTITTTASSIRF